MDEGLNEWIPKRSNEQIKRTTMKTMVKNFGKVGISKNLPMHICMVILIFVGSLCLEFNGSAQSRSDGRVLPYGHYSGRYVGHPGYVAARANFVGRDYYYRTGVYAHPYGVGYAVTPPVCGFGIDVLPGGYSSVYVGGVPYYYYGGTYYVHRGGRYFAVAPPRREVVRGYAHPYRRV